MTFLTTSIFFCHCNICLGDSLNHSFMSALESLSRRMPKVVREHEILRVAAIVPGTDVAKTAQDARYEVLKWAERRSGARLPKAAWDFAEFEYLSGGRNSVGVRIEEGISDLWAIRADDPDKNVPGRTWTTEVVIGFKDTQPVRFSARLLASTSESELVIEPHTPGFVQQVAEKCGLVDGLHRFSADPWIIGSEWEIDELTSWILNENRRLPVFVLTVSEDARNPQEPSIDALALARATLGIGSVVVLPAQFTWGLTESFGKVRSVFGGSVRAYLGGFSRDANPYAHRLVLADQLGSDDGRAQCVRWMRSLAATESMRRTALGRDVPTFAAVRRASLEIKQRDLIQEGASDSDKLAAANNLIAELEKQLESQKAELEYFDAEHQEAERRAEAAEEQSRASAFRIQQLLQQLDGKGNVAAAEMELPTEWRDFASWCDINLAGQVSLTPAARKGVRNPEFEDIALAARCLIWLATECRSRRMQGGGGLGDEIVEEGIRNSHCGSDQFDLTWQGQRYTADWHIKTGGNTRDPKRCLRIYYFWHDATQQIVVAEMPAHRHTDAS